ncbi:hypothetical protein [Paenibacillus jilunlii]|uniref:Uncharacterized protein n=1 Tax=Paenibacillus jilunlii TaxID=682956 RepID=A0A1G9H9I1_9BACL|nr:hypothetical protein [Paenibacillus jilunlii]KWX77450.1 hypothetical protein AML91_07860 [Paenibacillus jilunlii]SDL09579.1 hypothetical protein SAMN05216191_101761 [Paenibacillus jilunlii]
MKPWTLMKLPEPETLRRQMILLAVLDIICCGEEWLRVHRYDPDFRPGVQLGIVENGAGDHLYVLFTADGCVLKGFDHESPLSPHARDEYEVWPGMYEGLPDNLQSVLHSSGDTLEAEEVTFCLWQENGKPVWMCGEWGELDNKEAESGGTDFLLGYLNETPEDYIEWANDYFSGLQPLPLEPVRHLFNGGPVTEGLIAAINPVRDELQAFNELGKLLELLNQNTQI